jgi:ABC-type antimicrobial peptide transport system permease subunit
VQVTTYTITGVDVSHSAVGPVTTSQVQSGRFFTSDETDAKVALVDRSYAKQRKLEVGSTLAIDGTKFTVVGIVTTASGVESSNVYIPLGRAQKIADASDEVNRIYVKATSASDIAAVKEEIQGALPKATVTTADDLASQVSGSLASASSLSGSLGRWLAIAALVAAFAVASLLTFAAVGRRTREFGTLKALGWRSRRIVGQVMGESVVQGILGGILGIGLGIAGAFAVSRLLPSLEATVGAVATPAAGGPGAGGPLGQALAGQTVSVPLHATVDPSLLVLAIGLAVLGGILAGSLGGWRAARLRPAEALRRVE